MAAGIILNYIDKGTLIFDTTMNSEKNKGMILTSGNQITWTETMFYDAPQSPVDNEMATQYLKTSTGNRSGTKGSQFQSGELVANMDQDRIQIEQRILGQKPHFTTTPLRTVATVLGHILGWRQSTHGQRD